MRVPYLLVCGAGTHAALKFAAAEGLGIAGLGARFEPMRSPPSSPIMGKHAQHELLEGACQDLRLSEALVLSRQNCVASTCVRGKLRWPMLPSSVSNR